MAERLANKHRDYSCRCCGDGDVDYRLMRIIQLLESVCLMGTCPTYEAGTIITVSSGFRCVEHNKNIGGHLRSLHMRGKAVDFVIRKSANVNERQLAMLIHQLQDLGILGGFGNGLARKNKPFCHIDLGERKTWRYGNDRKRLES